MIVSTESVELYVDTLLRDPGPHFSVSAVANRQVSRRHRSAQLTMDTRNVSVEGSRPR